MAIDSKKLWWYEISCWIFEWEPVLVICVFARGYSPPNHQIWSTKWQFTNTLNPKYTKWIPKSRFGIYNPEYQITVVFGTIEIFGIRQLSFDRYPCVCACTSVKKGMIRVYIIGQIENNLMTSWRMRYSIQKHQSSRCITFLRLDTFSIWIDIKWEKGLLL